MIDYLERLFVREEHQREGEEDIASPSFLQMEEDVEALPVSRIRDEAQWQSEAVRRLEQALSVPESGNRRLPAEQPESLPRPVLTREEAAFEPYSFPERHFSRETDGAQELERRLRRDSRRYDSGFFLY